MDYSAVLLATTIGTIAAMWEMKSLIPLYGLSVIYSAVGAGHMRGIVTYASMRFEYYTDGGKSYEWLLYLVLLWIVTAIQIVQEGSGGGVARFVTCEGVIMHSSGSISLAGQVDVISDLKLWNVTMEGFPSPTTKKAMSERLA